MYNDIKSSYTIKLLLPESTKTKNLSDTLHNNAKLLIGYITKILEKRKDDEQIIDKELAESLLYLARYHKKSTNFDKA